MTDYGMVLMSCMARSRPRQRTARDLAEEARLPLPTVTKLLKQLLQNGLLMSHRGIKGGYSLARDPERISLSEIIAALEGPLAFTECSTDVSGLCDLEPCCAIRTNQQIISQALRGVLDKLRLSDLIRPLQLSVLKDASGKPLATVSLAGRIQ
jgi:FeS assembly SUF system regulator